MLRTVCLPQIGQLYKIFKVLGTPGPSVWPAVVDFPDWQPGFPQWQPQDLAEVRAALLLYRRSHQQGR